MRTAGDCLNELRRQAWASSPSPVGEIRGLVAEAARKGCVIGWEAAQVACPWSATVGCCEDDTPVVLISAWTDSLGTAPFAEYAAYRIGDGPPLVCRN